MPSGLNWLLSTMLPILAAQAVPLTETRLAGAYGKLPIGFEANCGQADARVNFLAHGRGYTLLLTATQATLGLSGPEARPAITTITLIGGNAAAHSEGLEPLLGKSNYLIGNDRATWRTNVANYAQVKYREVYPGVDLVYYGNQQQLEYDFVLHPGANPHVIQLAFAGMEKMRLDAAGDLILGVPGAEVRQHKPLVYQEQGGIRQAVEGRYVRIGKRRVGFELGKYDVTRALVIDPRLSYSTFLGGTSLNVDKGLAIAVDKFGNAYVTGYTLSPNFPVTPGAFQRTKASTSGVNETAFVTKLNAAGTGLVYSTYLGGSIFEEGHGIAVDSSGNAFVAGTTQSKDFPVTPGAFQTTGSGSDVFVTKLNASGDGLLYSTYLGGTAKAGTGAVGIALDPSGNAYVTGFTQDGAFPTTPGAFQTTPGFSFVAKLNPSASGSSSLVYSSFLGQSGATFSTGIAVNAAGNAFITGRTSQIGLATPGAFQTSRGGNNTTPQDDAFVIKLSAAGNGVVYATYLGGSGDDAGNAIAVDSADNAYVTGRTNSTDFPTTRGSYQTSFQPGANEQALHLSHAFVTKLNTAGNGLVYSTFLTGGGENIFEQGNGIAVDSAGNAAIAGTTNSVTFPITADGFGPSPGASQKAFAAKIAAAGNRLIFSTYLAGSNGEEGWGVAEDPIGNTYVTGYSTSANFPVTPGAFQLKQVGSGHGFVTEILADTGVTLTQSGLTFQSVQGGGAPAPQSFRFLNATALPLGFTISTSTLSGNNWLSIAPLSGSLNPDQAAAPTVSVNPAGLAPGDYYGQVRIDAPTAVNAPQFLTIVLNVAASTANPGPAIAPAGLVFIGLIGATNPLAQSVRITNVTTGPKQFTATATSNWFTFAPANATIAPGQPVDIRITPTASGLAPGIYRGSLTLQFPQDSTTRSIDLLMVISASAGCTSTRLLPVFTLPGSSFPAAAAWPTPIEAMIVDDCGSPLRVGSVVASFSDGDASLPLISQLDGHWSATWAPHQAPASNVNVSVAASHPDGRSGTAAIPGSVQSNPEVPLVNSGGVVNAASFAFPATPSSGEMVSVFGVKLADGSEQASLLPLKTQMQGATLSVAGRSLPLIFASEHQVNAIIPYGVAISASQQLIVRKDNRLAVPEPLHIASAEPAIFTRDLSGKGQGHIYVFPTPDQQILANAQRPVVAGDAIVIYCEGLGPVDPPVDAGAAVPSDVLRKAVNAVSITIGGQPAPVVFAGLTPGFTGLYQVNAMVPTGVPVGDQIPVVLTSGAFSSPPVTIAVR